MVISSDESIKRILALGRYSVDDEGNVISHLRSEPKILKPGKNPVGYLVVSLATGEGKNKTFLHHRVVAIAKLPNPDGLPQVNHIDGDKTHNSPKNLEWVSREANMQHAFATGLVKARTHLSDEQIERMRSMLEAKISQRDIARDLGTTQKTVYLVATNKRLASRLDT